MTDAPTDRDRNRAAQLLSTHWSAGRLTMEEYDERVDRALRSNSKAELANLFRGLPGDRPFADPAEELPTAPAKDTGFPVYAPPSTASNLPAVQQPAPYTPAQIPTTGARETRLFTDSQIGGIIGGVWMVTMVSIFVFGLSWNWIWAAILFSMFGRQILLSLKRKPTPPSLPAQPPQALPGATPPAQPDYSAPPPPLDRPRSSLDLPDDDPDDPRVIGGGLR